MCSSQPTFCIVNVGNCRQNWLSGMQNYSGFWGLTLNSLSTSDSVPLFLHLPGPKSSQTILGSALAGSGNRKTCERCSFRLIDTNCPTIKLTLVLLMGGGQWNTPSPLSSSKLWNHQRSSNALSWLLLNMAGLQNAIRLSVVHHVPKIQCGAAKTGSMRASRLFSLVAQIISRVPGHIISNKIPTAISMFSRSTSSTVLRFVL